MATYSRQMLSRHKTTATYEGQEEGRESMLNVTRTENGGESKYPERVITLLEPVA